MGIYNSVTELIGSTPLLHVKKYQSKIGAKADIFTKLEFQNPCGSVKDRVAKAMIEDAIASGILKPGGTIVEATSGNTGIALAAIGTALGFKVIIVMPETMSQERFRLVKAYGAELVLTPGIEGMRGAIAKAKEIVASTPNAMEAGQFVNPSNPKAHYLTTGPEIWQDLDADVDVFIAGVGTGGTITGVGSYLKEQNPNVMVVAVEPTNSPVLSEGKAGTHKIQGIGAGFIPETLDTEIYDAIIQVDNEAAFEAARQFGQAEGILVGISSGAALWAASELAKMDIYNGKKIVVLLPDTGERYLSTELWNG